MTLDGAAGADAAASDWAAVPRAPPARRRSRRSTCRCRTSSRRSTGLLAVDAARRPQGVSALAASCTRRRDPPAEARSSTRLRLLQRARSRGSRSSCRAGSAACTYTDGDLGEALGQAFVEEAFGPQAKADMLKMVAGHRRRAASRTSTPRPWMTDDDEEARAREAARDPDQASAIPTSGATTARCRSSRDDALGNSQRANAFEFRRAAGQDRQAGRQERVEHDAADRERVLQPARQQHQLPRRHPAAAVLQRRGATPPSTTAAPAPSSATS